MAREVVYTDDITGEHGAEPVKFGWDEIWWELDLTEANRDALLEVLQPYLDKAHPAETARASAPGPARRGRSTSSAEKIDYSLPEYAGNPHRGRVNPAEAEYVRENLSKVNARLSAEGLRAIDPQDQKMAERYGL